MAGSQSYAAYKDIAELIHCVVHWDADVVEYDTHRAVDAVHGGIAKIATHIRCYGAPRGQSNFPVCWRSPTRRSQWDWLTSATISMSQELLNAAQQEAASEPKDPSTNVCGICRREYYAADRLQLNGFIARLTPSTGIDAPLAARALWLEDQQTRCLIVSLDVLGLLRRLLTASCKGWPLD